MNQYLSVLKKYFVLQGRARRSEYWMFVLVNLLISIALTAVDAVLIKSLRLPFGILSAIYTIGIICPSFCVGVRRLHDVGRSGWWLLIALIPLIGALVLLIFSVLDSQPADNKYGPNPKTA